MILAFNPKMIDVFAKANGEIIQVRVGGQRAVEPARPSLTPPPRLPAVLRDVALADDPPQRV